MRECAVQRAMGISIHTGWAACVVVGGSLAKPEIVANERIEMLGDSERFCYHMAAEMELPAAKKFITAVRTKAVVNAKRAFARLTTKDVEICALVAKDGEAGELEKILSAHPRIHAAEGFFYREVLREACPVPVRLAPPSSLDVSKVGKLAGPPWGRDQKLAALAAWTAMSGASRPR
jgi:hypothetical protein